MATVSRSRVPSLRPGFLAVIVANLLPLVGVVILGWNVAAVVTLYWIG